MSLDEFAIEVDDAKLTYVKTQKAGSVERAGLEAIDSVALAELIKAEDIR